MKSTNTGTFRPRSAARAVSCCLFPPARNTRCRMPYGSRRSASLNATPIMESMVSVIEAATHLSRACGQPGVPCDGPEGGDVLGVADGGGEVGDGDDLGHLLDPRVRGVAPAAGALAVPGAQRDALAVGLHHDHVSGRQVRVRAEGPLKP